MADDDHLSRRQQSDISNSDTAPESILARSSLPAIANPISTPELDERNYDFYPAPPSPGSYHHQGSSESHSASTMHTPSSGHSSSVAQEAASGDVNLVMRVKPATILSLLQCSVCSGLLSSPTTLRCGHTVCSGHVQEIEGATTPSPAAQLPTSSVVSVGPALSSAPLSENTSGNTSASSSSLPSLSKLRSNLNRLPSCPIPTCSPHISKRPFHNTTVPNISPRVAYYPPPPVQGAKEAGEEAAPGGSEKTKRVIKVAKPKIDITIARVLDLVVGTMKERGERLSAERHALRQGTIPGDEGTPSEASDKEETDEEHERPRSVLSSSSVDSQEDTSSSREATPSIQPRDYSPSPLSPQRSMRPLATFPSSASRTSLSPPTTHSIPSHLKSARNRTPPSLEATPPSSTQPLRSHRSKRRRLQKTPPGSDAQLTSAENDIRDVQFTKSLSMEMQCEICFSMLHKPVTTPCQHTFCSKCLSRTLDHSSQCPLCRQDLPGYSYFHDHAANSVVSAIILQAFPEAYAERKAAVEKEETNSRLNTPIFVCQLSFPGMPTLLHFFEPRYRLMLRRCLQAANPCFGMIMPPVPNSGPGGHSNDYGTMLEVLSVQMLPDGRSMVETRGTYRFRILERGTLDGYLVGRIERVDDYDAEMEAVFEENGISFVNAADDSTATSTPSPANGLMIVEPTNEELMDICRDFYEHLRSGTAPWVVQQLNNTYGTMPDDPNTFSFWMALLLPIDEREKAKLLPIRSPRLRLRLLVYWIETLNHSWWFSSGCIIA